MKNIIRKILREQFEYREQLFDLLRTGDKDNFEMVRMISQGQGIDILELLFDFFKENPKPPYFKIFNHFDLPEDEIIYILSEMYGEPVIIEGNKIYYENFKVIYFETSFGSWSKSEYDENGNRIYDEDSDGSWSKSEYDENGNQIYYESSDGFWGKSEYDENGYQTYGEDSNGVWEKFEYDDNGNEIYYENSDGDIDDNR